MKASHWDDIYNRKSDSEVSWFQENATKSMELISDLDLLLSDAIIDIGGGNSRLVDQLLAQDFSNVSVLDISSVALQRTQERIGVLAKHVCFTLMNITQFSPTTTYRLWHDRAAFHFLTEKRDIETYQRLVELGVEKGGHLLISTFSHKGPDKCSELPVSKYSVEELSLLFGKSFSLLKGFEDLHHTPWGSEQSFTYCLFQKQ